MAIAQARFHPDLDTGRAISPIGAAEQKRVVLFWSIEYNLEYLRIFLHIETYFYC